MSVECWLNSPMIHEGDFVVEKLVLNVGMKAFCHTKKSKFCINYISKSWWEKNVFPYH